MRVKAVLLIALLLLSGCYKTGDATESASEGPRYAADAPTPMPTFPVDRALVVTDDGSRLIDVEVAETEEQREMGLMYREELPKDDGMVFIFFEDQQTGFWMKNTLIPLSIAFFDLDGKIVDILDMEPCKADPCPTYTPDHTYRGALEVNAGAFERWGVEEGDSISLTR